RAWLHPELEPLPATLSVLDLWPAPDAIAAHQPAVSLEHDRVQGVLGRQIDEIPPARFPLVLVELGCDVFTIRRANRGFGAADADPFHCLGRRGGTVDVGADDDAVLDHEAHAAWRGGGAPIGAARGRNARRVAERMLRLGGGHPEA